MYIILKDHDNGEAYEENYCFVNQIVAVADEDGDKGRVLTFPTIEEVKAYVHAQYDIEKTRDSKIIRDDDFVFSYTDGYDAITGYKWIDLSNPVIHTEDLIADFWRNR